ncbi:hypothetical protein SANTM175S_10666 [Streptomyces antimycoticus]
MARRPSLARALITGVTLFGVLGSLAACDAQTSESTRSGTSAGPRPITPVAGCAKGWTDPAAASAARGPARSCARRARAEAAEDEDEDRRFRQHADRRVPRAPADRHGEG